MAISYSVARWLAPAAFLFNVAAQTYGLMSTPNMKDVNDANLSFFSPQPLFVGAFFAVQQIISLAWLYRLWKLDPSKSRNTGPREIEQIVDYVPYYALGDVCIGVWMFFWNASHLQIANLFVLINTATQLYYMVFKLPRLDLSSRSGCLTHLVNKTFAGIAVLDLLQNTAAAYFKDQRASTLFQGVTGVCFGLAAASSDWIFGGCLVYDLAALVAGQYTLDQGWAKILGFYTLGAAAIVGAKNVFMPPYARNGEGYFETAQDDGE